MILSDFVIHLPVDMTQLTTLDFICLYRAMNVGFLYVCVIFLQLSTLRNWET